MSGTTTISEAISTDILAESVKLSQEFLIQTIAHINQLPPLQDEKQIVINQWVSSITMQVGTYVEITTLITRMIQKRYKKRMEGAKDSHINLLFVMKGINQAHQKGDLIALEELIKYELKDNLTQWKIDLIPQAKRLMNA
jgi:hypothetical protein